MSVLENANPVLRRDAVLALGTLGGQEAARSILPVMQDEDPRVRTAATYALGTARDELAVEALIQKVEDEREDDYIRGLAAEALSNFDGPEVVTYLIATLDSASPEIRYWAAYSLGQIADPQAIPALQRLVDEDHATPQGRNSVSEEAKAAIETIGFLTSSQ